MSRRLLKEILIHVSIPNDGESVVEVEHHIGSGQTGYPTLGLELIVGTDSFTHNLRKEVSILGIGDTLLIGFVHTPSV